MKFSILIANYNNGIYFKDCYDSIITQTYQNWEAIIVDDHSSDNSIQIIKELIENDSRFTLHENERNYGCGYTKRRCAELATGEICGFLDPDDALTPEAIELMIIEHSNDSEVSLVHSSLFFCDANLNITSEYHLAKPVYVTKEFTNLDYAVNHFATFKKIFYNKTSGIDSRLKRAVDQDLYLKLSEVSSFSFLNAPLYKYRIHKLGIASNNGSKAFYCHLKVIMNAEIRRCVDLEEYIGPYLQSKSALLFESYLNNPRYILFKLKDVFFKSPKLFFRNLLFKQKI